MRFGSTLAVMLCAALCGCAAGQESTPPAPQASASHPGDAAMTCPAIEAEIAQMNAKITNANQMTTTVMAGATSVNQPQTATDSSRLGGNNPHEENFPGIGTNGNGFNTGGTGSNEALDAQKASAGTATERANQLIVVGRAKRCFA